MVQKIAADPDLVEALASAHARARARFWELTDIPESRVIDIDATLINLHSEKERAAGNDKGGYGFHPLTAYTDETRETVAMLLRPGKAGSNTAADHITVCELTLARLPLETAEAMEILSRTDSAGATHKFLDHCHAQDLRFSVGFGLSEHARAEIIRTPRTRGFRPGA